MSDLKPKKSTKTTKPKVVKKEVKKIRVKKPNFMLDYEKGSYLENLDKTLNLWKNVSSVDNMNEELKTYIYTKLEECIYDKIINPHTPWHERLEIQEEPEEEKEEEL